MRAKTRTLRKRKHVSGEVEVRNDLLDPVHRRNLLPRIVEVLVAEAEVSQIDFRRAEAALELGLEPKLVSVSGTGGTEQELGQLVVEVLSGPEIRKVS